MLRVEFIELVLFQDFLSILMNNCPHFFKFWEAWYTSIHHILRPFLGYNSAHRKNTHSKKKQLWYNQVMSDLFRQYFFTPNSAHRKNTHSKKNNYSRTRLCQTFSDNTFPHLLKLIQRKFIYAEAVVQRCSVKQVFLKILQNSQERARISFLNVLINVLNDCIISYSWAVWVLLVFILSKNKGFQSSL